MSELSLREEIDICVNSGLTPTELFILRLLFLAIDGDSSLLVDYLSNIKDGKVLFRNVLVSLQEKKVILSGFKIPDEGESLKFDKIPINKNFIKMYLRESNELGKELFEKYPMFMFINNKMASIRNITKGGFFSLDDFSRYYAKQIKLNKVTHDKVMSSLEDGINNNLIRYSLLEFIASQKWNEIDYIMNSGNIAGYDNTEML